MRKLILKMRKTKKENSIIVQCRLGGGQINDDLFVVTCLEFLKNNDIFSKRTSYSFYFMLFYCIYKSVCMFIKK